MQLVLERCYIDEPLTFDVGSIQLIIPLCSPNTCKGVFNPNVATFQSNCVQGLHFSTFHYYYYGSQDSDHAIVHLGLNVSSSAHNCGCVVDGGNAMAAI